MDPAVEAVRREALWFEPTAEGMGPIVDALGAARLVLIGEATHGTHEFYRTRAELTKTLISAKGFNLVAVEADSARHVPCQPMGASRHDRNGRHSSPRRLYEVSQMDVAEPGGREVHRLASEGTTPISRRHRASGSMD